MRIVYSDSEERIDASVVTIGNFDGIHLGHKSIMSCVDAYARDHHLNSVVVTFDPHTVEALGKQKNMLICDTEQKYKLIEQCAIDYLYVIKFNEEFRGITPEEFVRDILVGKLNIKMLVLGANFKFGRNRSGNIDLLIKMGYEYGYDVIQLDILKVNGVACSSSKIRELISTGDVNLVSHFLGRSHIIGGEVITCSKRGRMIGFPTANIEAEDVILPRFGVYKSRALINGIWHDGISNIGIRPTFGNSTRALLETHIFSFDRDIYGEHIYVKLLRFIREERKFSSMEEIRGQIQRDIGKCAQQ